MYVFLFYFQFFIFIFFFPLVVRKVSCGFRGGRLEQKGGAWELFCILVMARRTYPEERVEETADFLSGGHEDVVRDGKVL